MSQNNSEDAGVSAEVAPAQVNLPSKLTVDVAQSLISDSQVILNLGQEVHITTRDKVELGLRRTLPDYSTKEQLAAAVGVFVAFVAGLLTSEFHAFASLSADTWRAVFLISSVLSGLWMIREVVRWIRRPSIQDVVDSICEAASEPSNGGQKD